MNIPNSLEPLRTYFERARDLAPGHPYAAQFINIFAANLAMKTKGRDAGQFMLNLMDEMEAVRAKKIQPPMVRPPAPAAPAAPPSAPAAEKKAEEEGAAASEENPDPAPPPAPPAAPAPVKATPEQALKMLALDLFERARAADKPNLYPSVGVSWSASDAPKVAQCLHACAVILDCMKQFNPKLPDDVLPYQKAAHQRSKQLAGQLANAFKTPACIPLDWQPVDLDNLECTLAKPPPPMPPPVAASLFPSAPTS
jgi:hypothetical protein